MNVPAGTPACLAPQLEAAATSGGAATGHVLKLVVLRNKGAGDCQLAGFPDVAIFDVAGRELIHASGPSAQGTAFMDAPVMPVLLVPGTLPLGTSQSAVTWTGEPGQAYVNIEWADCRHRMAATLVVTLPRGGGDVESPFAFAGPYSPVCDTPAYANYAGLNRGPVTESGAQTAPVADYIDLRVAIKAPASVRRGQDLHFAVIVTNRDRRDLSLDSCPDYNEFIGSEEAGAEYQLNCKPVGALRSGDEVTFEMEIHVTPAVGLGTTTISWALLDGRVGKQVATSSIMVVE